MLATFYIKCRLDKGALKQQISNKTNGLCVPITKKKIAGHRCWTAVRTSSTQHPEFVTSYLKNALHAVHNSIGQCITLTLEVRVWVLRCAWPMVNVCAKFFFNGWRLRTRQEIYSSLDNVDLWSPNVTLTLEVRF